ncbi:MAG TPA: hypothetical protein VL914_04990 [Vicinamibacterales bacterium]|nr:hypothetical protein [Vicinamibacterales bacterium]
MLIAIQQSLQSVAARPGATRAGARTRNSERRSPYLTGNRSI